MPAETAPQERVWMAFPPAGATITADARATDEARTAWARVANTIADFEPVTMVVDPADRAAAQRYLSRSVERVHAPLDDAWMRDIGPSFVLDEHERLAAVDWTFNGWGQQDWARWGRDALIGAFVARHAGAHHIRSSIVNEGGAIAVDGLGTVLLTETVQLDPYRNPSLDKAGIETELAATIGATHAIWLPRGLTRDAERFGTRGHVDIVAAIPSPGRILLHWQRDPSHPDHEICRQVRDVLADSRDAAGRRWEIVGLPAPKTVRDDEGWVDYSYVNHLVVNGAVVGCAFADPNDEAARGILAECYPGREVVMLDSREIFARGGGIHCITQQQPRAAHEGSADAADPGRA